MGVRAQLHAFLISALYGMSVKLHAPAYVLSKKKFL